MIPVMTIVNDQAGGSDTAPISTTATLVDDTPRVFNAMHLKMGKWDIYTLIVPANRLGDLMRQAPQALADDDIQRGYNAVHAKKIAKYLIDESDWQFGPITCALPAGRFEFNPLANDPSGRFGTLSFSDSPVDVIKILDGQHRRGAIGLVLEHDQLKGLPVRKRRNAAKRIADAEIEVRLVVCDTPADRRRLFAWMQRQRPLKTAERVLLDGTDSIDSAVQKVLGVLKARSTKLDALAALTRPLAAPGGRDIKASEPYWLTAVHVRDAMLARRGHSSVAKAVREIPVTEWLQVAHTLFVDELPRLRPEWQELLTETESAAHEMNRKIVRTRRGQTFVYAPVMIALAARTLHTADGRFSFDDVADMFTSISFDATKPDQILVRHTAAGTPTPLAKTELTRAANQLLERIG